MPFARINFQIEVSDSTHWSLPSRRNGAKLRAALEKWYRAGDVSSASGSSWCRIPTVISALRQDLGEREPHEVLDEAKIS